MSSIFTEEYVEVPCPFQSFIKQNSALAFKNYKVWLGFNSGAWVFWDNFAKKIINQGQFEGNKVELVHLFYRPLIFDEERILYIAVPKYKLTFLNPTTGKLDQTWDIDCPTVATLPANDRNSHEKAQDVLDDMDMLVLEKSKTVVIMERRDQANNNSEYALTAYVYPNKMAFANISTNSQMKKLYFKKMNDEDTVMLYSDYQQPKMKVQIWNLKDLAAGLKEFNFEETVASTIIWAGPWGDTKKIVMFGNPDQGNPQSFEIDLEKNSMPKPEELTSLQNYEVIVEDAVWTDPKRHIALLEESGYQKAKCLSLYNIKTRRTEFGKEVKDTDYLYLASPDNKYVVGHKCQMVADEDPKKEHKTPLYFYTFTKKKIWVLFLMKRAKIQGKNESLLQYYGSPYIAQHVAEMIGK